MLHTDRFFSVYDTKLIVRLFAAIKNSSLLSAFALKFTDISPFRKLGVYLRPVLVTIGNIQLPDFPLLLAPMEDVSDPPFRAVCKLNGADLMYTEFISSEGLIRDAMRSRKKLDIFEEERPVGIQIFGGDEEAMAMSDRIVETVNPNLLDINFGCPVKKVVTKGAGAGVLKNIDLMVRLTEACVRSTKLPVTVKTRLGWDDNSRNIVEVAEPLPD